MRFKVRIPGKWFTLADPRVLMVLPVLENAMWASVGLQNRRTVLDMEPWGEGDGRRLLAMPYELWLCAEWDPVFRMAVVEGELPDTAEAKALVTALGALAQGHDLAAAFTAAQGPSVADR